MDGGAGLNGGSGRWGAEEGGILWEGSQSNYRQRCSPGFFGGTKFTFQRSLPPSPRTFLLLPLSLPLPASSPFLISTHRGSRSHLPLTQASPLQKKHHHPPSPPFAHPSIFQGLLEKRRRYRTVSPAKASRRPYSRVMLRCEESLQRHTTLQELISLLQRSCSQGTSGQPSPRGPPRDTRGSRGITLPMQKTSLLEAH